MRATTVRFSEDLWDLLEAEATTQRISAAQFVRDAAIMRLGILSGRRGDREAALTLEELAAGALTGRQTPADPVPGSPARLKALKDTDLMDSESEEAFDRLAKIETLKTLTSAVVSEIELARARTAA